MPDIVRLQRQGGCHSNYDQSCMSCYYHVEIFYCKIIIDLMFKNVHVLNFLQIIFLLKKLLSELNHQNVNIS